jgi:hypothetical protein
MKRLYDLGMEERSRVKDQVVALLAAESRVAFAYLYGSFAEAQSFHDVDVGVYLRHEGLPGKVFPEAELAQRLSEAVKLPVDVRVLNGAPVSFLHHVLRGTLLVSHDDDLLGDIMEDTIRRYLDMAPLLRRSTKEAFAE